MGTHPPWPCFPLTQTPWSLRVSSASKLPNEPEYHLWHVGPSSSILRPKLRKHLWMVLWSNKQTKHTNQTTSPHQVSSMQLFHTRRPYSLFDLASFLNLASASHLPVHDIILLFCTMQTTLELVVHWVPRTKSTCLFITPEATLVKTFHTCSSIATMQTKPHATPTTLGQELVHTKLSINHH
jgi:hypothetical protein